MLLQYVGHPVFRAAVWEIATLRKHVNMLDGPTIETIEIVEQKNKSLNV